MSSERIFYILSEESEHREFTGKYPLEWSMDDKKTGPLSEMAQNIEVRLTESLLRWRYKRQGKTPPADDSLKSQSRIVTEQVNEILLRRGKNLLKELRSKHEKE